MDKDMSAYLAMAIKMAEDETPGAGATKYAKIFSFAMYKKYQEATDVILTTDGYEQCIVTTA